MHTRSRHNQVLDLKLKPLTLAVLTALAAGPQLVSATTPVAPGQPLDASEFLVNASLTTLDVLSPKIARDASGDFVVVWTEQEFVGTQTNYEIIARRYNAAGLPQSSAFLVNTVTTLFHVYPTVAMDAAGDFVVAWTSYDQAANNSAFDIYARQYHANGSAVQTSEFLINTFTGNKQDRPAVAMDAAGDFVVVWMSYGQAATDSDYDIYARQYHSDGTAVQASEFLVNTVTINTQALPAVAMDAAGDFVVAWGSYNQAASNTGNDIYARQYQANGSAVQASEFLVNTFTSNNQAAPTVAMDATGDLVVAWISYDQAAIDSDFDVYARQYHSNGTAVQTSEFLVNTFTSDRQALPTVAMDAAGDFVVAWMSYGQAATYSYFDIYARQFHSDGTAVQTSEFLVNTFTSDGQANPTVAMDAAGDFVVAYDYYGYLTTPNENGIYARRYQGPEQVDLKAGLTASPTSVNTGGSVSLTASLDNNTAPSTLVPATVAGSDLISAALGTPALPQAAITLPSGVNFTSASGSNWTCPSAPTSGVLTCSYTASLAPGNTGTPLTVNVTAPSSSGNVSFTNAVSSLQEDSNPSDNSTSAGVTVTGSGGGGSSGGGGGLGLLSLLLLGLPLLRKRRG